MRHESKTVLLITHSYYPCHWFLKASFHLMKEFRFQNYEYPTIPMELLLCFLNGYEKR